MFNSNIELKQLAELFINETPLIDVRAPVEFKLGSLPQSSNLPILSNEEREKVGTVYKQQGQSAAITLGQSLVSGEVKERRLMAWKNYIEQNPRAVIYCFRGGLRSRTTQTWLREIKIERPLIVGGYKRSRHFLMSAIDDFSQKNKFLVVSGPTGSGKTLLVRKVKNLYPAIDLEALAHHRGSAFGAMATPQPTQIDYENNLAVALLQKQQQLGQRKVLVEDESRMIGKISQPEFFFQTLRNSEVIWLDESLDARVDNIFQDYILDAGLIGGTDAVAELTFAKYEAAVKAISRKLGGARTIEIIADLQNCRHEYIHSRSIEQNKIWIRKLLMYYYDPLYLKSLGERKPKVIFKGTRQQAFALLQSL